MCISDDYFHLCSSHCHCLLIINIFFHFRVFPRCRLQLLHFPFCVYVLEVFIFVVIIVSSILRKQLQSNMMRFYLMCPIFLSAYSINTLKFVRVDDGRPCATKNERSRVCGVIPFGCPITVPAGYLASPPAPAGDIFLLPKHSVVIALLSTFSYICPLSTLL